MKIALQSGQGGAQLKMLWQLYMDNFACGRVLGCGNIMIKSDVLTIKCMMRQKLQRTTILRRYRLNYCTNHN